MKMTTRWFEQCYVDLVGTPIAHWLEVLPKQLSDWTAKEQKTFSKYCNLLEQLPVVDTNERDISQSVRIGNKDDISPNDTSRMLALLRHLMPWRKGPFELFGEHIDTEWRSDWKWDRVALHVAPLAGKYVLDVGCGSGYHLWRMLGEEAKMVIGIDPTPLFLAQFYAIKHFYGQSKVHMLPLGIEQMPELKSFDTVFSMGVLYHRRDPIQFITELKNQLSKGGQLVLETLVVDGDENTVLMPTGRYAQMRNVWFLPSTAALTIWLSRLGFEDINVVDESMTTLEEQRTTEWMTNQSLADFLDPIDHSKTIEGYPAPKRAVLVANKK